MTMGKKMLFYVVVWIDEDGWDREEVFSGSRKTAEANAFMRKLDKKKLHYTTKAIY
jgi:hypothetical protein